MKRLLHAALAAMIFPLIAVSCVDNPDIERPTDNIYLSKESVTVESGVGTTSFNVVSKTDWTLASDSSWITPDVAGGAKGTQAVTLTIGANGSEAQRTGKVTITGTGETEPLTFTVTQKGESGSTGNDLTGINKWIYDQLGQSYYWNAAVKAATPPDGSLTYDTFLKTLILSLKGAEDTTENPATIDGGYDYDQNGTAVRYVYSNITRTASTRASESEKTTFGFDIYPLYTDSSYTTVGFFIRWVQPGSPADKAGIKRGMWFVEYNGKAMYFDDYVALATQLYYAESGTSMTLKDEDGKNYSLTATTMKASPIIYKEVITSGAKKVAYLVYNEFERGEDGEFDKELQTVFGEFKTGGATELVLDLRYNLGGYVNSSQLLSSLAGNVSSSKIFAKLLRNSSEKGQNPQIYNFLNEPNSLKLNKIYVLATGDSASASEMVINSLRGVDITVVHIGTTTEGKNVGMDLKSTTTGGYSYEMWPITFKIKNAKDFCDYAGGFTPNYVKDEFWDVTNKSGSGVVYELGDPKERLLAAALTLIGGGTVTPDNATRAEAAMRPVPALRDPSRGGAKYIPEQ